MAALAFKKATKAKARLRAALFGPSGAGKTFTAASIATGLGGRIAVIDTERGSASKYADRFEFDVLDLDRKTIADYIAAIDAAATAGYDVLIIDSLSHAWQELLADIDNIARAKYRGNTWSAWSEGTPKQRKLVEAILSYPGHVIGTMRSKTEWSEEKDERSGKVRPVRVGLSPEQGKGIEYEFDLLLELSVEHVANVIKDRTGKFQDKLIEKPGAAFGKELAAWLNEGTALPSLPRPLPAHPSDSDADEPPPVTPLRVVKPAVHEGKQEAAPAPSSDTRVADIVTAFEGCSSWDELTKLRKEASAAGLNGQDLMHASTAAGARLRKAGAR